MTIAVAFTAQDSGTSALELASVLSLSIREPLVVTVVVTTPHAAGAPEFVDGDYLGPLTAWGQSVFDQARGAVPPGIEATYEVRVASSTRWALDAPPTAMRLPWCSARRARVPWAGSPSAA